jgi:polysaccharide pyruvyl transferase WcaK-like protein
MKALLIHAYSTTNSGDGLLVREAVDLLLSAYPSAHYSVLALDPESFHDAKADSILHPLTGSPKGISSIETLARGAALAFSGRRNHLVQRLIDEADLVLAVGGGYLRGRSVVEATKTFFTHFVQLPRAADRTPFVYLPQSIGPLKFGLGSLVRDRLRHADAVIVRDERSFAGLRQLENVSREPDMALLGLPEAWKGHHALDPRSGIVGVVARALSGSRTRLGSYNDRVLDFASKDGFEPLAQATGRGNNDPDYYRSIGIEGPFRPLVDALDAPASERPDVVISVRLHGAIQTIRSGVPSVHLSYERKGWGAFKDLGISEYVHNAFDFDPDAVLAQVASLQRDSSEYWGRVTSAIAGLSDARTRVTGVVRSAADKDEHAA